MNDCKMEFMYKYLRVQPMVCHRLNCCINIMYEYTGGEKSVQSL